MTAPIDWFAEALAKYPRLALTGGSGTGKTALSHRVGDRRIVHGDDYIKCGWSGSSDMMARLVNQEDGPVFVEGVQVPRALRKGMRVDAVIWLDKKLTEHNRHHTAQTEGMVTVFREWRLQNPHIPIIIPAPVPQRLALPKQEFP